MLIFYYDPCLLCIMIRPLDLSLVWYIELNQGHLHYLTQTETVFCPTAFRQVKATESVLFYGLTTKCIYLNKTNCMYLHSKGIFCNCSLQITKYTEIRKLYLKCYFSWHCQTNLKNNNMPYVEIIINWYDTYFLRYALQFVLTNKSISDQFGSNVSSQRKKSLTSLYNTDFVSVCVARFSVWIG